MTQQNDPPVSNTPDSDDDWDDVVFDDTETPLDGGAPAKKSGKMVKYAGILAVCVALGAGGLYWLEMQPDAAPVTPASLAAMQPQQPMPVDTAMPAPNDPMAISAMPDGAMPADGADIPVEVVENIDLNALVEPGDDMGMPPLDDGNVAFPPMPESETNSDMTADLMIAPDMPADMPVDVPVGADVTVTSDMPVETDVTIGDDEINVVVAPDAQVPDQPMMPGTSLTEDIAANDALIETQVEITAQADNSAQDVIDQRLEEELIASLSDGTANAPVVAADSSAEEALINSMDEAMKSGVPPQQLGETSRIEANAYIRPTPEKYYIIKQESAPVEVNRELMAGKRALNEGHNGRALDIFNSLYEVNPNDTRITLGRAVALQRMGRYNEAINLYEQVLRENPENLEALTNMLGILSVQNPAYSVENLQRLHSNYPANAGVKVQLALAYGALNYPRESISLLTEANNLEPQNPTIAYNLAVMYDRMGDRVSAAQFYRNALVLERDSGYRGYVPVEAIQNRLAMIHQ